jgi:tetratricopeptide (TPR) repeat protein
MLLEWFNAREAMDVGAKLAHYVRVEPSKDWHKYAQRFRQRVAREAGSLKLNPFKRAKLLNSFKWTLKEHGFDSAVADQLTHEVLMQLCVPRTGPATADSARTEGRSLKRIPALLAEAGALFADGKFAEAASRLEEVLTIDGRNADAYARLGAALCCLGRYGEAQQALRRAIAIKGACGAAHLTLGNLLRDRGEFAASETALRRAVKQDPRSPQALVSLGLTLGMRKQPSATRDCFERAQRLKPRDPAVLSSLAWLAGIEGRFEEAEKVCRAALEADSTHPGAWALLAGFRRMTDADGDWLEGAERTLARRLAPIEESKLRYAMGKYFDDLGKYSRAFEQYRRANELQKLAATPYDRSARTKLVDETIGAYTVERLARPVKGASDSPRPVIVTGMARSGTSLVEQIIASHPRAIGAGELDFWNVAAHTHRESMRGEAPDESLARKLGGSYLKVLEHHSANALRVVDKSTVNTDRLGLIHSLLPGARMIYLQRDPVDTCLSCYFQDFANVASFSLDLADLAHYYREHHRLISHWRSALPEGSLLLVPYAELVADPGTWSRRIVEFIGLEWDSRCLQFHQTARPVLTASNWQVRQPVYSRSVGRWENYKKFIGPLLELRELGLPPRM